MQSLPTLEALQTCVQNAADSLAWLEASSDVTCELYMQGNEGRLESIITSLEASLLKARYLHNRRLAVNTLPPEILSNVFKLLEDRSRPIRAQFSDAMRPSTFTWTRVMGVCKYWRWIALETTSLWSFIQIKDFQKYENPESIANQVNFASTSLQRSGSGPLTVRLETPVGYESSWWANEPFVSTIFSHMHRISELRLSFRDTDQWNPPVIQDVGTAAPELQVLVIHGRWGNSRLAEEDRPEVWLPLNPLFQAERCPRLRVLSIETYYGWLSGSLQQLRNLYVGDLKVDRRTATEFHNVLSANARLETLVVYNTDTSTSREDLGSDVLSKICMNKLRRIVVSSCAEPIYHWIHHLLQPAAKFALQYSSASDGTIGWANTFHPDDRFPAERVYVGKAKVVGCTDSSAFGLIRGRGMGEFLRSSMSCQTIVEITISTYSFSFQRTDSNWIPVLRALPNVIMLGLACGVPLWLPLLQDAGGTLPALRELHVYDPKHTDGVALFRFLRLRRKDGHGLRTLRIMMHPVRYVEEQPNDASRSWRCRPTKLSRLVDELDFRDISGLRTGPLKLPKVCGGNNWTRDFWDRGAWSHL